MVMENQMEETVEHKIEAGVMHWFIGIRVCEEVLILIWVSIF